MSKKRKKGEKKVETILRSNPWFNRNNNKLFILFLFLLPLIYFAPFLSPNRMIAGSDYLIGGYPFEKWIIEQEEIPFWYTPVFSGMPVLGAPGGGPLAPLHQLRRIIPPHVVLTIGFILAFFLGGLGTYLYVKEIIKVKSVAFIAGLAYICIGNVLSAPNPGHLGRTVSITLFPLMLYFLHRGLTMKKAIYFIFSGGVAALTFYEGHFQITYYSMLVAFAYGVFMLVRNRKKNRFRKTAKLIGYAALMVVVIVSLFSMVLLPVISGRGVAARGEARGFEFSTSWATPPLELIDLTIPTFSGILGNYWGANFFKQHTEYIGIIPLVLFIIGLSLCLKKSMVKFYLALFIVAILIALGGATPFFRIPFHLLPGFDLFRGPSKIFYLVSFSVIVIGAYGLRRIMEIGEDKDRKRASVITTRYITIALILLAGWFLISIILSVSRGAMMGWMRGSFYPEMVREFGPQLADQKLLNFERNYPEIVSGAWRTFLFLTLSLSILYLVLIKKVNVMILTGVVTSLILMDSLPIGRKFLSSAPPPVEYYRADEVVNFLKRDTGLWRVFPYRYEHAQTSYLLYHNIESLGGYTGNPIGRYQELIGAGASVMFRPDNLVRFPWLIDMLNTKYIISYTLPDDISGFDERTRAYIMGIQNFLSRFRRVARGRRYSVYLNENYLARAFIVKDYKMIENPDSLLSFMLTPLFNPREIVLLEEEPEGRRAKEVGTGLVPVREEAKIVEYTPNRVTSDVTLASPGFLVLSSNYHPDWKAYVDGEEVKLYIANYTLKAVYLNAGRHRVEFVFEPKWFKRGALLSLFSLLFLLGTIGFWLKGKGKTIPCVG